MNQPAVSNGESIFNLTLLSMAVLFLKASFQFNLSLSNFPEVSRKWIGGVRGEERAFPVVPKCHRINPQLL